MNPKNRSECTCVLLSIEESERSASPLQAWSRSDKQIIEGAFDNLLQSWKNAWGIECEGKGITLSETALSDQEWFSNSNSGLNVESPVFWKFERLGESIAEPSILAVIVRSVFGQTNETHSTNATLSLEIAEVVWHDWWQRLASLLGEPQLLINPNQTSEILPMKGPWSGDLVIAVPWPLGRLHLWLDFKRIEYILRDSTKNKSTTSKISVPVRKSTLLQALSDHSLAIHAELKGVELTLGQLQDLSLGDVIPLEHCLDRPVLIKDKDEHMLCVGWLGQQQGHLAIQLAKSPGV